MARHTQSSFSAGELDPALHERTTFDKYQSGLATLRNAVIGKTGRIISRAGTKFFKETKVEGKKVIIYSPPFSEYLIEWGDQYVRIHDTTAGSFTEDYHLLTESDLPNIQFIANKRHVYIFCAGKKMMKMVLGPLSPFDIELQNRFVPDMFLFYQNSGASIAGGSNGSGYQVEYVATYVLDGQESLISPVLTDPTLKLAINPGEYSQITIAVGPLQPSEMRVYRRPAGGNAFGYIGSSGTLRIVDPANKFFDFKDYGEKADYGHSPPSSSFASSTGALDPLSANPRTGAIYQQRLIITESKNEEAIHASRTGHTNNFYRDYPLAADSALTFKAGTSGNAKVLRILDSNGLIVFTTAGIYVNEGPLGPENLTLVKKGNWVIEDSVPPLEIPGGVIFIDKSTNTVRTLIFSNEAQGYPGEEISIFSNHLFLNKKIISWSFQDGDIPLVWVVFDDGSLVSLTYQREHQMQAWGRHDTDGVFESTTTLRNLSNKSSAYFVVKRGNKRYIEYSSQRFLSEIKEYVGMDSSVTFNSNLTALTGGATFTITALDITDWEGELYITCNSIAAFTNTAGGGAVGTEYRFFDSQGSAVDLLVTQYIDNYRVKVQPSVEFPSNEGVNPTLYILFSTLTGLQHLESKVVSLMVDGYVIGSPNNNVERYGDLTVVGGSLTLPNGMKGAFVHVGLPFTVDVETLDVDTVEQKPTLLESKIVSAVFIKIYRTRGIFVAQNFPSGNTVENMEDPEERKEDLNLGNVGNAAQKPVTQRHYLRIPNDWNSNGRICIRQVDPLPVEILSIIPDLTIL